MATFNITTAAEKLKTYTPEQIDKMQKAVIASGNKAAADQFASALAQSKTGVKTPIETFQSGAPKSIKIDAPTSMPIDAPTTMPAVPQTKSQVAASSNLVGSNAPATLGTPTTGYTHKISDTETASFTPTKTIGYGVAYNEKGTTDMERLGLTKFQIADVNKYLQNLGKDGIPDIEKTKLTQEYIKTLQTNNTDVAKFGLSYGSDRAKIPTDPTKEKGSIENFVDLNNNGIPDSEEKMGLEDKTTPSSMVLTVTDPVTGKPIIDPTTGKPKTYNIDTTNFNELEKTVVSWKQDMSTEEIAAKKRAADAENAVTNASAKKLIDLNNEQVGNINALLDERIQANKDQYRDAVGNVYRTLGGQARALQRIIGSDGAPMDDATMLSLMGDQGVESMQNIVDLKNKLVNDYIAQKQKAIEDIYKLQKENVITENEAAAAVQAVNARTESDVIDLTKTFYKEMFGITEAVDANAANQVAGIRSALGTYMTSLGMDAMQQTKIINDYVKEGYTVEEAQRKIIDDINAGNTPIPQNILENNQAAAAAAQAKLQEDLLKLTVPIQEKGRVEAILQDDKQEFEAQQNALDRQLAKAKMISGNSASSNKKISQSAWDAGYAAMRLGGYTMPSSDNMSEVEYRDLFAAISRKANGIQDDSVDFVLGKYGYKDMEPTEANAIADGFQAAAGG